MRPSGPAGKNKSPNACVSCCIKGAKWFPVLFIVSVVIWSYYAYVIELCLNIITNQVQKIAYLIIYHALFALFIWCYWKTVFSPLGLVPNEFKIPNNVMERLLAAENEETQRRMLESYAKELPLLNRTLSGAIRYCDICQQIKPDRSHHCSVCGACVLKMDHHCPWVNNCVGYTNYKFFILFLAYGLIYCLFITLTTIEYFLLFWKSYGDNGSYGRIHVLFLFFVALMFAISLLSLFCYHCYLVTLNRTTLEAFRPAIFRSGPDKHGFYLGKYPNFKEVFGEDPHSWPFPVFTSLNDGIAFPTSADQRTQTARYAQQNSDLRSYESMGTTKSSLGDGTRYPSRMIEEDTESLLSTELWSSDHATDRNGQSALLPIEDD